MLPHRGHDINSHKENENSNGFKDHGLECTRSCEDEQQASNFSEIIQVPLPGGKMEVVSAVQYMSTGFLSVKAKLFPVRFLLTGKGYWRKTSTYIIRLICFSDLNGF